MLTPWRMERIGNIVSSWIVEHGVARPLGTAPKLAPGQHRLTPKQDAERRANARDESARRRATR